MKKLFKDLPEALENNYHLSKRCSYRPKSSNPILPNISSNKDGNADQILRNLSIEGLENKFKTEISKYEINKDFSVYKKRLPNPSVRQPLEKPSMSRLKIDSHPIYRLEFQWLKQNSSFFF